MAEMHGPRQKTPDPRLEAEESIGLGYQATDANTQGILITGLAGLWVGICIFLGVAWMFNSFLRDIRNTEVRPSALREDNLVPPEPRLELNPHEDLLALRKEKRAILHSRGWIDRKAGWVHISIDDAMKLLVEEDKRRLRMPQQAVRGKK